MKRGISIIEVLIIISIIVIFIHFSIINSKYILENIKVNTMRNSLDIMRKAIYDFYTDHSRYPYSLLELTRTAPYPYLKKIPIDPTTNSANWEVKRRDTGMRVFHPFTENGGTTVHDWSGNNNISATIYGATWTNDAVVNYALEFDGVNDYVYLDDTSTNSNPVYDDAVTKRTVSVWYKANDIINMQIIYEEGGGVNGLNIYIINGSVYVGAWSESDGWNGVWLSTPTIANTWHQVAYVFDGKNNTFKLYYDGNLITTNPTGSNRIYGHTGNDAIGAMIQHTKTHTGDKTGNGYYFNGIIDEFRLYDKVLTDEEIKRLYTNPEEGLGGWWDRDPTNSNYEIIDVRSHNEKYKNI